MQASSPLPIASGRVDVGTQSRHFWRRGKVRWLGLSIAAITAGFCLIAGLPPDIAC